MLQTFFNNNIDHSIVSFFLILRNDFGIKIFSFITSFADFRNIEIISASVVIVLLINKKFKETILFISTLLLTSGLTNYLKDLFFRPRPISGVVHNLNYSFPSGHSSIAMALYGFIIYLLIISPRFKYKYILCMLLAVQIIAIGFSRMYLGVHYLSDVIAGYLLGLIILFINVKYFKLILDNGFKYIIKKYHDR